MEKQVGAVVEMGIHSEELNIQHVGQPRNRMPVGGVSARECPMNSLEGQTGPDVRV